MSSQVRGDGSQGSGPEIRFSAILDNDVTRSRGTRYAQLPSHFFFLPPNVFLTFYRVSLSSLKSGSLFIRAVKGPRFICRRATRSRLSPLQIAASRGNLSAHLIGHRRGGEGGRVARIGTCRKVLSLPVSWSTMSPAIFPGFCNFYTMHFGA